MMNFTEFTQDSHDPFRGADSDPEADGEENVAQQQNLVLSISEADKIVGSCNELVIDELHKFGRKIPTPKVVAGIYTAYRAIEAAGCRDQFLAARKIRIHGNTKNVCYPVFLAFTRTTHPWLRDRVCKYAEVGALAVHHAVSAEDFPEWLKRNPIEKACAEYRKIMRDLDKSKRDDEMRRAREFLVDPKKEPEKAPILRATPITRGYAGLMLGVLDFSNDRSGDFRVLGILPHDRDAVMRIVKDAANKTT